MTNIKKILWGIVLIYLQVIFVPKIEIWGIIPNILIAYIIFIAVFLPIEISLPWAFLIGLAYDLTYPILLGINTISFLIIIFVIYHLHQSVNKSRFSVIMMGVLFMNVIYYSINILYYLSAGYLLPNSIPALLFALIYNSLISVILIYLLAILDRIRLSLDV